ncbi:LysR family transcriptional regulator [Alicyclobacillus kakegawensis]|uniref:LysR family transcriptional regulator n=1 Tax=Alicyclobacillus kakegawensis TaxID=392012 RepID=UPI000833B2DC|nr:LysR family transcriptional regulator [Alicyclobacillus kakegawensis]
MELHQLEYFLAVEKYGTFSAAALEINVSQSSLSQQIRKLEDELGVKLFIRGARLAKLTPAGEEFFTYARRIITEIQNSRYAMQEYTNFHKGHIKIGVIPTIGYLGIHRLILRFSRLYPGIEVDMCEANTDDLLLFLNQKKIQVAFITSPYSDEFHVDFHPLIDDDIVLLVPIGHRYANESIVYISEFSNEKFLMIKSSSGWRDSLVKACNDCGFTPNVILTTSSVELLRNFVEEGVGVALMGQRIAKQITTPRTSIVQLKQDIKRQNGLVMLPIRRPPLATRLFRDFVLQYEFDEEE